MRQGNNGQARVVITFVAVGLITIVVGLIVIFALESRGKSRPADSPANTVREARREPKPATKNTKSPPTANSVQIIDDSADQGFSSTVGWMTWPNQGYKNGIHYAEAGDGSKVAAWTFPVAPGKYSVSATWFPDGNRATNAPFSVLDGTRILGTVAVDQKQAPVGFLDEGVFWQPLGTFTITGKTIVVKLSNKANNYVIADAIRVQSGNGPPVTDVVKAPDKKPDLPLGKDPVPEKSELTAETNPPAPPPFKGDPLDKPLLTSEHLEYLGCFSMPRQAGAYSTAFTNGGLTHRYVNGGLRFLSTSHVYSGGLVYEVKYPGLSRTKPPTAQLVTDWKDIYEGKKWVDNDGGGSGLSGGVATYGLNWCEEQKRLYWNYGHWYNATNPYNPCLGYSTLDDNSGKASGVGAWRLRDRPEKFARGGSVIIPSWFAKRFTKEKTLGVGFGGYFSIVSTASLGPALCAVAHPDIDAVKHKGVLEQIPLIGYPLGQKPPGPPDRCHRNPDYRTEFDNWNPTKGVGYWTWMDEIGGAAAWLDLPDKQAVVFFCVLGHGRVWYEKSERNAERGKYWCMAYHPRDLSQVALGRKKQWEVQPRASWEVSFGKEFGPEIGPSSGGWRRMVCGATFDAKTRRLYVLVSNVWKTEVESHPRVYCWRVN
jgi:hypothetical protein